MPAPPNNLEKMRAKSERERVERERIIKQRKRNLKIRAERDKGILTDAMKANGWENATVFICRRGNHGDAD